MGIKETKTTSLPGVSVAGPYSGYAGLPPLVGLLSMEDAAREGLTVSESVERLKRFHWTLKRLHRIFVSRITATPIYELKMAWSLHAHYCAEHVSAFALRVREMRQPPYGLDQSPEASLDFFFDEIEAAPDLPALLLGLYGVALPQLDLGLKRLMEDTNRLFDHPTYRVCRFADLEVAEMVLYGTEALLALVPEQARADRSPWLEGVYALLSNAGGLDGSSPLTQLKVERSAATTPYVYDPVPRRDERFIDSYNLGVNAEAMLFDETIPPQPKTLMLFFKRMREIDVPEMMSSIMVETPNKPWNYYRDMTRQLWDEARHAMMGEVGLVSLGIDWSTIPFNFTWALGLNTQLTPLERHAVLFAIEQGLMPKKAGKEHEWELAVASASRLSELIQDYDWADEILHARIGRDWLVPELGSQAAALAYGDRVWSKILADWEQYRLDGLTEHKNWWPDVYREACRHWGVEPDAKLLAYETTYQNIRPDMKQVATA